MKLLNSPLYVAVVDDILRDSQLSLKEKSKAVYRERVVMKASLTEHREEVTLTPD